MNQPCFAEFKSSDSFGGELAKGKRKSRRPFSSKKAIHLTLRSSFANGVNSLRTKENAFFIDALLKSLSARHGIRVYEFANGGTHLHLLFRVKNKELYKKFIRAFSGKIAQHITKAVKGKPFGEKFWDRPPWTRLVCFGKAFQIAKNYVIQNTLEALGLIAYKLRKSRYQKRGPSRGNNGVV